jgi:S1-C subfamily serine protease
VIEVNGSAVSGAPDLVATIRDFDPGTTIVATVVRDGREVELTATLVARVEPES